MSDNNYSVDKNSFPFIFTEDLYIISSKEAEEQPVATGKVEEKPKAEPIRISETPKKSEPEKKTPSIPKIPTTPAVKEYSVLVDSEQEFESGKEFLGKILGAIKLDFTKVTLYTTASSAEEALSRGDSTYFIAFGLDAGKYQQVFNKVVKKGKNTILFSNRLSELQQDVEKKKALWAALQQLS